LDKNGGFCLFTGVKNPIFLVIEGAFVLLDCLEVGEYLRYQTDVYRPDYVAEICFPKIVAEELIPHILFDPSDQ
jgi:hypothetical protein